MKSLKTLIVLGGLVIVLSVAITLGVVSGVISYNSSISSIEERLSESTSSYSLSIQSKLDLYRSEIKYAASNASHYDENTSMDVRKAALAQTASFTHFKDFSISDANGITYSDTDIHDREYFIKAMQGITYISSPLIRRTDDSVVIMAASKISGGDFTGAIYGGIDYSVFSELISGIKVAESGYGFIVDKDGVIVAHKDDNLVRNSVSLAKLGEEDASKQELSGLSADITGGKAETRRISYEGQAYFTAFAPIEGAEGWSLVIMVPAGEVMENFYSSLMGIIIATIIMIGLGMTFSFLFGGVMSRPITQAADRLKLLSQGDLGSEVKITANSKEINDLSQSLQLTIKNLNIYIWDINYMLSQMADKNISVKSDVEYAGDFKAIDISIDKARKSFITAFKKLGEVSDEVRQGAEQISAGSETLAENSVNQSASLDALRVSVENISSLVSSTVENTNSARAFTTEAVSEVNGGNEQMKEMLASMEDISRASDEIAKINKTIEDIAFQTNILALNASVEAARAGAAGKGFAVVAGEVRNLAIKSAEAAKVTKNLIEESIKVVANGTKTAAETAQSLKKVVETVDGINKIVDGIAVSAANQAKEIGEVSESITAISDVTQSVSAASEEYAASSREFMTQANTLNRVVGEFKID